MGPRLRLLAVLPLTLFLLAGCRDPTPLQSAPPPPAPRLLVLTHHNDNQRTGANLAETVLHRDNVRAATFGKLFSRDVDGYLYAQPLYVSGLRVGARLRNVVFVATEHNSVYAFDADDPAAAAPLWHRNFGPTVPSSEFICVDLIPEVGITSTPVIDLATRTIYVVAKTKEDREDGAYVQRLHALDLVTGEEKLGGPVEITARVPGTGLGTDGTHIAFRPQVQLNRPALTLSRGKLYIGFGSHCDRGAYHGWLLAYDAATLRQVAAYNVTPDGELGSIWQSGQGPAVDEEGNLYVVTANGSTTYDGRALGDSFVKLSSDLRVLDWFTPYNHADLTARDDGLGSAGPLLVPGSRLMMSAGKPGVLYVLDRDHMGRFRPDGDTQIVQRFQAGEHHLHGAPIYWHGPGGEFVYLWTEHDRLKMFRLEGGKLDETPFRQGALRLPHGMPGGILSLSADGAKPGTGILWATTPVGDANKATVPGILHAYDAEDVSRELWHSSENAERDALGSLAKFCPPTVVNGKVYMSTFSGKLVVYGLLPQP